MPLLPYKYIKEKTSLPKITPWELAEKLSRYGLETEVVEYENSLYLKFSPFPNRPDLFSGWGIIQEIGVIFDCQTIKPIGSFSIQSHQNKEIKIPKREKIEVPNDYLIVKVNREKPVKVAIITPDCHEFCLGLIKNIEIKESPIWIKEWLEINNIRSINNVVDIANLVMLETGQPIHIFDYDVLPERKIVVGQVQQGKKIETIQGQKLVLNSEDIVVSSGEKIIDLAGIIGTKEFSLNSQSKNILIECAYFNPKTIQKTAKRLNISTIASQFFCRKGSLFLPLKQVLQRVIPLIIETYQGDLNSGTIFSYQEAKKIPLVISISKEFITKKIGQDLTVTVIENIWQQLKFFYQRKESVYYVTVPLSRSDITIAEDLLEEFLRVYDYNKVVGFLP